MKCSPPSFYQVEALGWSCETTEVSLNWERPPPPQPSSARSAAAQRKRAAAFKKHFTLIESFKITQRRTLRVQG